MSNKKVVGPPPQLDLEGLNAEWKAKQMLNEDGKPVENSMLSPTGTDSTEEPPNNSVTTGTT